MKTRQVRDCVGRRYFFRSMDIGIFMQRPYSRGGWQARMPSRMAEAQYRLTYLQGREDGGLRIGPVPRVGAVHLCFEAVPRVVAV